MVKPSCSAFSCLGSREASVPSPVKSPHQLLKGSGVGRGRDRASQKASKSLLISGILALLFSECDPSKMPVSNVHSKVLLTALYVFCADSCRNSEPHHDERMWA